MTALAAMPLALPWTGWRESDAPRDRDLWVRGNHVMADGCMLSCEPYEGFARWEPDIAEWVNRAGMCLRADLDEKFHVREWMEVADRARDCPDSEMVVQAHVYYWDDEWRVADGMVGFFALYERVHQPTGVQLMENRTGPFASLGVARDALVSLILSDGRESK